MTNYKLCPSCAAKRLLICLVDGKHVRICFRCYAVPRRADRPSASANSGAHGAAAAVLLACSLVAGPVWAEQIVLDGKEFAAHLDKDAQVVRERDALRTDRDNLEQQVGLYKQNETNYKRVIQRLKDLDAKTLEKEKAQADMIALYEQQQARSVAREQELIEEVRKVKTDSALVTWKERGTAFAAGVVVTLAVVAAVLRGGR